MVYKQLCDFVSVFVYTIEAASLKCIYRLILFTKELQFYCCVPVFISVCVCMCSSESDGTCRHAEVIE